VAVGVLAGVGGASTSLTVDPPLLSELLTCFASSLTSVIAALPLPRPRDPNHPRELLGCALEVEFVEAVELADSKVGNFTRESPMGVSSVGRASGSG
jgi:hypothetical protein